MVLVPSVFSQPTWEPRGGPPAPPTGPPERRTNRGLPADTTSLRATTRRTVDA